MEDRGRLHSKNIVLYKDDISNQYVECIRKVKIVAWDTETSGLDWRKDRIGICQLHTTDKPVAIVKIGDTVPARLRSLLSDSSIKKIFHHATFDLRFMSYHWKVLPQNVVCTKIASKLLDPNNRNKHTLEFLLKRYLGVVISKRERLSDWLSNKLTEEQVAYAAKDVMYLRSLLDVLENELEAKGLIELANACFAHIPARVQLDILGYGDMYSY